MTGSPVPWAVLIPAGPGKPEVDRVADLLESLYRFEPSVSRVVVVDDGPEAGRDLRSVAGPLRDRTSVITNPRARDADWWTEGVLVGIAAGLELLLADRDVEWVLRMDTDALVIGPVSETVTAAFAADPQLGMVGCYDRECDGSVRDFTDNWARTVRKYRMPISVWPGQLVPARFRRWPKVPGSLFRSSLLGVGRERRRLIERAQANGYQLGEHCQGGAYAISMRAVRAMNTEGLLDCRLWRGTVLTEDVVMGIQVRALGFSMAGMADPGEPFGVTHQGLPGDPQYLVDAGYGVVHSVKTFNEPEADLRRKFRQLREATPPPAAREDRPVTP